MTLEIKTGISIMINIKKGENSKEIAKLCGQKWVSVESMQDKLNWVVCCEDDEFKVIDEIKTILKELKGEAK